jgi:hypothetical protein
LMTRAFAKRSVGFCMFDIDVTVVNYCRVTVTSVFSSHGINISM